LAGRRPRRRAVSLIFIRGPSISSFLLFVSARAFDAGMDLSAKLQKASPNRINAGDTILLFAFDAVARNMLLELARQIFFELARNHDKDCVLLTIAQKVVKRPKGLI
jgi:hypothetical protein